MNVYPDITFFLHIVIFLLTISVSYLLIFKPFLSKILARKKKSITLAEEARQYLDEAEAKQTLFKQKMKQSKIDAALKAKTARQECMKQEEEIKTKITQETQDKIEKIKTIIKKTIKEELDNLPKIKEDLCKQVLEKSLTTKVGLASTTEGHSSSEG